MARIRSNPDGRKPHLTLIATGGTISMVADRQKGGPVPEFDGSQILAHVPGHDEIAEVQVRDFGRFPGPHMTIDRMWSLRQVVLDEIRNGADGVVVTHGTDTIEETAYLLDRSIDSSAPVVITGAMRSISELSWDGPANLMASLRAAAAAASRGRGVMVVMDERIVQGAEAVKTHTEAFGTFESPNWGPLGIIDGPKPLFYRESRRKEILSPQAPVQPVDLIKIVAGADSRLLEASLESGAAGIVIEAMGRGNVPPAVLPGIQRWLASGKPVVLTSRSLRGRVLDAYGYPGGGHELREKGVIFSDHLTGQQARIELMLALGVDGIEADAVRARIEADRYDP